MNQLKEDRLYAASLVHMALAAKGSCTLEELVDFLGDESGQLRQAERLSRSEIKMGLRELRQDFDVLAIYKDKEVKYRLRR